MHCLDLEQQQLHHLSAVASPAGIPHAAATTSPQQHGSNNQEYLLFYGCGAQMICCLSMCCDCSQLEHWMLLV